MKFKFHILIISIVHTILLTIRCSSAAQCNQTCGHRKLQFPFGFSAACQIQLNCSGDGMILAADFPVQSVNSEAILVNIPAMCGRPVETLRRLFTASFAPTSHNAILLHNCRNPTSSGCLIPLTLVVQTRFGQLDCEPNAANISCYSEADNATSFIDYENLTRTSCSSLLSAIAVETSSNRSSGSLDLYVVRVGWWLRGDCRCSRNANCVRVSPPRDVGFPAAYRCECLEGFDGDGFLDGEGCRKEVLDGSSSKSAARLMKYILPPIISTMLLVIIVVILIRRRKLYKAPPPVVDNAVGNFWRITSYNELVRATDSFSNTHLLGRGSFGSVFKCTFSDGLNVAVKVFDLELKGADKSFKTESKILSTMRHRNLVRVIGCCTNMEFKALILEFMPNGSLDKWLYSYNYCLDLMQRIQIAIDVALALEYLHHGNTFPIVHCDIKPSNLLLDEDMTACVADFGIAKLFDEGEALIQTKTLATIGYAAPEYGLEGKVSTSADVYSYGIMLLEMFTGKKPTDDMFHGEMSLTDWVSEALQVNAINEILAPSMLSKEDGDFNAKEECVAFVFELAMKCLAISPKERLNMIEVVATLHKIKAKVVVPKGVNNMQFPLLEMELT